MICITCKKEVAGELRITEGQLKDRTMFVLLVRSRDCDWMSCDSCAEPVHIRCYPFSEITYCSQCMQKHKLQGGEYAAKC